MIDQSLYIKILFYRKDFDLTYMQAEQIVMPIANAALLCKIAVRNIVFAPIIVIKHQTSPRITESLFRHQE